MSRWYLDTSAAAKLVVQEAESDALAEELRQHRPTLVACLLLETELRRVLEAGLLPGATMGSLDALHLAAAIRLEVEAVITYDVRMAQAATALGMTVLAPV